MERVRSTMMLPSLMAMTALALLACGGSNQPAAAEAGSLSRIEAAEPPITFCIPGALASQQATDRIACLLTVLDERRIMAEIDPRGALHGRVATHFESLGPEVVASLDTEIDRLFDPETQQASFESKLAAGWDDTQGRAVLDFYATDLGTRYATAHASIGASRDDAADAWLQDNPVSEARTAQLSALFTAAHGPDMLQAMLVDPARHVIKTLMSTAPAAEQARQLEQVNTVLLPMIANVTEAIISRTGYTLREFDDAALAQLIEAERAPHAQWFTELRVASYRAVVGEAYSGLARAIVAHQPRTRSAR